MENDRYEKFRKGYVEFISQEKFWLGMTNSLILSKEVGYRFWV